MKHNPNHSSAYPQNGTMGQLWLDSGAHSLFLKEVASEGGRGYAYYDSDEFWAYVDRYAEFLKANSDAIDYYASVDVLFDPKRSWQVLKVLEDKHGLSPVPVIHYGTPFAWLEKHLNAGYEYIGIGGIGQHVQKGEYYAWADKVFLRLCPAPSRLPIVRTHGFAMTSWELMFRYPWFSVDSTSWRKSAGFGGIYVPHRRSGKYVFTEAPYTIQVSKESPANKTRGRHITTSSRLAQSYIEKWLEEIEVPLGKINADGTMEWGVVSENAARMVANLKFFERMVAALPVYPWPFKPPRVQTRQLF